jgi:arginine deiminase
MRDPQIVLGDRVVVASMATQARRRESLLSKYVFEHHPRFKRADPFWVDFMETGRERPMTRNLPTLEGGDVLVPRRDLLLVGVTERTNKAGVETLIRSLRETSAGVRTVIIVEVPRQRSFMHLDTIFTFINRHECLIYPPVILPSGSQAAKVTTVDLTKKRDLAYSEQKSLLGALKKKGFNLDPIYCGGKNAVDQQREQWTDGANAFALAPGIILLYERNVRTAEALARNGYHIVYEDDLLLGRTELETWTDKKYALQIAGNELSRARGGPRCMTMPLEREEV